MYYLSYIHAYIHTYIVWQNSAGISNTDNGNKKKQSGKVIKSVHVVRNMTHKIHVRVRETPNVWQ